MLVLALVVVFVLKADGEAGRDKGEQEDGEEETEMPKVDRNSSSSSSKFRSQMSIARSGGSEVAEKS